MKLIHNHTLLKYQAIWIGVSMLLSPSFAIATQTSVYQEVTTSSNTGGQRANQGEIQEGSATVQFSSETVIDGVRSSYYFSTTSAQAINHQVIIENGVPIFNESTVVPSVTSAVLPGHLSNQEYLTWLTSMITLIKYLQQYVEHSH